MDRQRENLKRALRAAGFSAREASKRIGRNPSYIAQFLDPDKMTPRALPDRVRRRIARLLEIDERQLMTQEDIDASVEFGAAALGKRIRRALKARGWSQAHLAREAGIDPSLLNKYLTKGVQNPRGDNVKRLAEALGVPVPWLRGDVPLEDYVELDAVAGVDVEAEVIRGGLAQIAQVPEYNVRLAAGEGFHVDRETRRDMWPFSASYLRHELRVAPNHLVIVEVMGDSMSPTLESGDRVLIDRTDRRVSQPGIFALWDGDGLVIKRLELVPGSDPPKIMRISDNPLHRDYEVLVEDTQVIGRLIWYARRM